MKKTGKNTSKRQRTKWGGHALFGKLAYEALPGWERNLIKPDMSPVALAKPYLRGSVRTVGDKVACMCGILDMVYYDESRPYATFPDGRWIPHSPPDSNSQSCVGSCAPYSHTAAITITETLMGRMIEEIRAGHWEEAIRWGGALGHYLQEPFTPGHAINNNLFHELFPDPDPQRHMRLHHAFDQGSGCRRPGRPRLMGTSLAEAAFRLQIEIDQGIRDGKKLVAPIIQSVYAGEPDAVRGRLLARQATRAAYITACAWHTAICIALKRFNQNEVASLASVDLMELVPTFLHHSEYVEVLPGFLVQKKKKIPIHIWSQDGQGVRREERIKHGFGMTGHMGIKFFVNGDVYPRFRCRVGLPSRHTEGQTENTNARFYVEMDTEENKVYSEDIEYKARRIVDLPLIPGQPVQEISADIRGARTLILAAQSKQFIDKESGEAKFSIPHLAVCEPVLMKA